MNEPASLSLSSLLQISMPVRDIDRAVAFYRDVLGMRFLFEVPGQLAFFDCDGVWLMLSPPEGQFEGPGSVIYFAVDDIHASYRTLTEREIGRAHV